MVTDNELSRIVHVLGIHETLKRALKHLPLYKPFDPADTAEASRRMMLPVYLGVT